jgi:hypothetical protein
MNKSYTLLRVSWVQTHPHLLITLRLDSKTYTTNEIQDLTGKSIQQEYSFHQQTGHKFTKETSKLLYK